MKINKYWFKPKRFGYGATPITWEGWAVVIVFIIYIISLSSLIKEDVNRGILYLSVGIVAIWIISKNKTDGEWKWNWKIKGDKKCLKNN